MNSDFQTKKWSLRFYLVKCFVLVRLMAVFVIVPAFNILWNKKSNGLNPETG